MVIGRTKAESDKLFEFFQAHQETLTNLGFYDVLETPDDFVEHDVLDHLLVPPQLQWSCGYIPPSPEGEVIALLVSLVRNDSKVEISAINLRTRLVEYASNFIGQEREEVEDFISLIPIKQYIRYCLDFYEVNKDLVEIQRLLDL